MDLFEQFGITPETQQIVTVFSLVFTLVYPLVRWGMIPAVRWAFKRRPRSELFQVIVKKMEETPTGFYIPRWLQFGKLEVDTLSTTAPIVKWDCHPLDDMMTRRECLIIHRIAQQKNKERIRKQAEESAKQLVAEIQPQGSNGPFQFCANGMPYVPDKPAVQVVFTPACSPTVESNLTRQEGMEASQPTQGDESVKELEEAKKTIEDFKGLWKERDELLDYRNKQISNQAKTIRDSHLMITSQDEEIERLKSNILIKDEEFQSFLKKKEDEAKARIDELTRAITEADKTIKNQQDLIDRLNRERVGDVIVQPYKDSLNRVTEKTQIEDVKELARIMCTTSGHLPDEKEVNAQEIVLREAADRLRKEHGSHYRVVWEKPHGGVYWVPVLKASGPVLNIPKQT